MINRLIAPTSGTIRVDGVDTASVPAETLRRGIGYVIQGHGLFPHWTVARNIATVPRLLGWRAARIDARVRELLALFELDYDTRSGGASSRRPPSPRAFASRCRPCGGRTHWTSRCP